MLKKAGLQHQVRRDDAKAYGELYQLLHLKTTDLSIPGADLENAIPSLDPEQSHWYASTISRLNTMKRK